MFDTAALTHSGTGQHQHQNTQSLVPMCIARGQRRCIMHMQAPTLYNLMLHTSPRPKMHPLHMSVRITHAVHMNMPACKARIASVPQSHAYYAVPMRHAWSHSPGALKKACPASAAAQGRPACRSRPSPHPQCTLVQCGRHRRQRAQLQAVLWVGDKFC